MKEENTKEESIQASGQSMSLRLDYVPISEDDSPLKVMIEDDSPEKFHINDDSATKVIVDDDPSNKLIINDEKLIVIL